MRDLAYVLAYLLPLSGWLALELRGPWSWATILFAFVIIPLIDALAPVSTANVAPEKEAQRSGRIYFDLLLYICAPICWLIVWKYLEVVSKNDISLHELLGLTLGTGIVLGATGINVAHELGHRSSALPRLFAKAGLLPVLYQHFFIEHNRGHHKYVATPEDPATARRGENVYLFFLRTLPAQYKSAWHLECERLRKNGLRVWSIHNTMLRFAAYQMTYLATVSLIYGWKILPLIVAVATTAIFLLEVINYIEHYGLMRRRLPGGAYERVMPRHSWNSDHGLGRIMLFELTRHSDHHYKASRRYQILRHLDDSPQLPTGYPGSMLMALVPPLWFSVMERRLCE